MAEQSEISWTDATFNPWIGCTKVSPACDHCYAERDNGRRGWVPGWGSGAPRRRTSPSNWQNPRRWDRKAAAAGRPLRVFCASLADVFDNEVPQEWREDLWQLIRETPHLRWIILSKRIGNAHKMLPKDWGTGYPNAGLMATLENQEVWDRDYRKLKAIPAAWHGVSAEPLLGPIDIGPMTFHFGPVDWIITGGERGPGARPMHPDWARDLRDQCHAAGVPFFFKQWGEYGPCELHPPGTAKCSVISIAGKHLEGKDAIWGCPEDDRAEIIARFGKKAAGDRLDGVEHKHFPAALAA